MKKFKSKKSKKKISPIMEKCMRRICKYYDVESTDVEEIIEKFYKNKKKEA